VPRGLQLCELGLLTEPRAGRPAIVIVGPRGGSPADAPSSWSANWLSSGRKRSGSAPNVFMAVSKRTAVEALVLFRSS
jgi:hypothetical protein